MYLIKCNFGTTGGGVIFNTSTMYNFAEYPVSIKLGDKVFTWEVDANNPDSTSGEGLTRAQALSTYYTLNTDIEGGGEAIEYQEETIIDGDDYNVTAIGSYVFQLSDLTSVIISEGITTLGFSAFANCKNLETVIIPEGVTVIRDICFSGCVALKSVQLPSTLEKLDQYSFSGSGLTKIVIPSSVKEFGSQVFRDCRELTEISVDPNNTLFDSRDNCNAIIRTADNTLIVGCNTTEIPNDITTISHYAFKGVGVGTLILPESVTEFKTYAFSQSTYDNIIFSKNITTIGEHAFYECENLLTIDLSPCTKLTTIEPYAFYGCTNVKSITIPSAIKTLGNAAFGEATSLTELNFNATRLNNLDSNNYVFKNAGSNSIDGVVLNVGANVQRLPDRIFNPYSSYASTSDAPHISIVNFPENSACTSFGYMAFSECDHLEYINLPESLTSVGAMCFRNCKLTSIEIPPRLSEIAGSMFTNCSKLTNITIPETVTSIGSSAFSGCYSLTEMTILATTPPTLKDVNAISTTTTKIYIPSGSLNAYSSATNWSNFANKFVEI